MSRLEAAGPLDAEVLANRAYRRVIGSDYADMQWAAMAIRRETMGESDGGGALRASVGWEVHENTTQYFALIRGAGTLLLGNDGLRSRATRRHVSTGDKWIVPRGVWHDIEADHDLGGEGRGGP